VEVDVSRVLAYCGWLHDPGISLPEIGVNRASVQVFTEGRLSLLWSKVDWPFDSASMQQSAIEFHRVVNYIFLQTAVVPFRLLTIFEDEQSLMAFGARHGKGFVADLERRRRVPQSTATKRREITNACADFYSTISSPFITIQCPGNVHRYGYRPF